MHVPRACNAPARPHPRPAQVKREFASARAVQLVSPSPDAVAPPCPLATAGCGGCKLQGLSYAAQLRHKDQQVERRARRSGQESGPRR